MAACTPWPPLAPPAREARIAERQARQRQQHRVLLVGDHARHVPLRDVRDFVREHACELRLVLREQDETGVDADVAAGQRKGVDLRVGHREELEVLLGVVRRRHEPVPELVQVVVDLRVLQIAALRADLADDRLADLAFLRGRERDLRRVAEIGQRWAGAPLRRVRAAAVPPRCRWPVPAAASSERDRRRSPGGSCAAAMPTRRQGRRGRAREGRGHDGNASGGRRRPVRDARRSGGGSLR